MRVQVQERANSVLYRDRVIAHGSQRLAIEPASLAVILHNENSGGPSGGSSCASGHLCADTPVRFGWPHAVAALALVGRPLTAATTVDRKAPREAVGNTGGCKRCPSRGGEAEPGRSRQIAAWSGDLGTAAR